MSEKVRISLDVTPEVNELLDTLQEKMGVSTKSEVLRKAIALIDVAVDANEHGKKLIIADSNENIKSGTEIIGVVGPRRSRQNGQKAD